MSSAWPTKAFTHGEYVGSKGRQKEANIMEALRDEEDEERARAALMTDTTGEVTQRYVARKRAQLESLRGDAKHAAMEELFMVLSERDRKLKEAAMTKDSPNKRLRSSNGVVHITTPPPLLPRGERALLRLTQAVPATGKVPWSWTAARLGNENNTSYASYRTHEDANLTQLHQTVRQIEETLKRAVPPGSSVHRALWHAAARPPWLLLSDGSRGALTLQAWSNLLRELFGIADVGLALLHSGPDDALRVAYIGDWYIEGDIDTVAAIVLDCAGGREALGLEAQKTGVMLHLADLPAEAKEKTTTWWYVGTTLADMHLIDLVNAKKTQKAQPTQEKEGGGEKH